MTAVKHLMGHDTPQSKVRYDLIQGPVNEELDLGKARGPFS